jgi:SWI/SNF-related matrix-associated actin-dependent regulator 1 of chromatin subfamily A
MATLKSQCPVCGKDAKLKYETPFGKKVLRAYTCGHTKFTEKDVETPAEINPTKAEVDAVIKSVTQSLTETHELTRFDDDGGCQLVRHISPSLFSIDYEKRAYEYQEEGIEFIEKSNFRCLIADAMGLGKTVQALIALKRNIDKLQNVLIIVKGATTLQWCEEFKDWIDDSPFGIMPIVNRECILPGFKYYVISMDFIGRKGVLDKLKTIGIKTLVLDECQAYKNDGTGRTAALFKFITEQEIQHIIALSGTPIKNRAVEYFSILNILDPEKFYSKRAFERNWLEQNDKGQYTRIADYMMELFRKYTSKYILRREKRDVLKNLPPVRRNYVMVEITDPAFKDIYNSQLDLFQNFVNTAGSKVNSTVLLGWLAKMRGIAGQAKVEWAMEYIQNVMDDTDESLAVGIHHHSVRDTLYLATKASGYDPLKLSGEDDIYQKDRVQRAFNEGRNRLLIINELAGGVGLNLQKKCHHFVALERMWNSADEEQFEARFDRNGQEFPVEGTYPIAAGTIDEWFHDMVAEKRKIFAETMGDKHADIAIESDDEFIATLVERTLQNRLK